VTATYSRIHALGIGGGSPASARFAVGVERRADGHDVHGLRRQAGRARAAVGPQLRPSQRLIAPLQRFRVLHLHSPDHVFSFQDCGSDRQVHNHVKSVSRNCGSSQLTGVILGRFKRGGMPVASASPSSNSTSSRRCFPGQITGVVMVDDSAPLAVLRSPSLRFTNPVS
jgi:hypothetical protein